jgi:hypothetical protein
VIISKIFPQNIIWKTTGRSGLGNTERENNFDAALKILSHLKNLADTANS